MWNRLVGKIIDPVEACAGAAVLFTVLSQHISSRHVNSELPAETICWIVLPLLFRSTKARESNSVSRPQHDSISASSSALWLVAGCLVLVCLYREEIGVIGLLPALTPLYLIAEKRFQAGWQVSIPLDARPPRALVQTMAIWGAALAAVPSIMILSNWETNLQGLLLSIIFLGSLLVIYITLTPRPSGKAHCLVPLDIETDIIPLSQRVVMMSLIAMAIQAFAFGLPNLSILLTVLLGLSKSLSWYFTSRTIQQTSWSMATIIITFSIMATRDPFIQSSDFQALSHVFGSFLTLGQIIYMLKKQAKAQSMLWCLSIIFLIPYFTNLYAYTSVQTSSNTSFGLSHKHPAESLIINAKLNFDSMLQRQSQDYAAAVKEYSSRYNVEPPEGFESWFNFAKTHHSPIIDDFDIIFERISPFLKLSGKDFTRAMEQVQKISKSEVWICSFSGANAETSCKHPNLVFDRNYGYMFTSLLANLKDVPNVNFLVNHFDEPRIIRSSPQKLRTTRPEISDMSRQSTWDMLTSSCSDHKNLTSPTKEHPIHTFGLPFVTSLSSTKDLCQNPEYRNMHGLFMSPASFFPIEGLSPILSTSSLTTMGDILIPSPAYMEPEFQYNESHDVDWSKKCNNLYWAGSTTGAFAQDSNWTNYQRQRFVQLAQNLQHNQHSYLRRSSNGITTLVKSSFMNGRLYNVFFTKFSQCKAPQCRAQRSYFHAHPIAPRDEPFRSRLVFDLDGNGISGRYYKLLASKSLPLKQTILKEWHDERLVPWLHYVPVSLGMEELPELVFWLTSTEAGRVRAKEMAEEGRAWFQKALREVDRTVYVYRLLLELARLQDPTREAS